MEILVVEDSQVVRFVLTTILSLEPGFNVRSAPHPLIAMEKMKIRRPDVIVLDLGLPEMDGLTFLDKIMAEDPIPVVICSALTGDGAMEGVLAMEKGAVEIITKPKIGVEEFLHESEELLVDAVRAASQVGPGFFPRTRPPVPRAFSKRPVSQEKGKTKAGLERIIAMGASTGGTEALRELLIPMPKDSPGVLIVQHMPENFTRAFATRLNGQCQIEVKEAESGDRVYSGRVLISPGNRHMELERKGRDLFVKLNDEGLVNRHRPSVDVLFKSLSREAGGSVVGIILTGMGSDGAEGLWELKQSGAVTLAQDKESSVVFGMPRSAIERGAVDEVVPLYEMLKTALKYSSRPLK